MENIYKYMYIVLMYNGYKFGRFAEERLLICDEGS